MAKIKGTAKTEVFTHECGGKVKMVTRFINRKSRLLAVCGKCGAEARKVRELVA